MAAEAVIGPIRNRSAGQCQVRLQAGQHQHRPEDHEQRGGGLAKQVGRKPDRKADRCDKQPHGDE
jgi:hypothetical protein